MAKTTRILGPGLPEGGVELLLSDPNPGQMTDLLADRVTVVPLVDDGVFVFRGGAGSPFSILQTVIREPEPEPTRVSTARRVR